MLKKFSWPYRILVLLLVLGLYGFMRQPAVLLDDLRTTLDSKDEAQWQMLTQAAQVKLYSKTMLQGLLKMQYAVDWESDDRVAAMNNYYAGQSQLDELSSKFAGTEGFRHFLCGDLTGFLQQTEKITEGCWDLGGVVHWLSPVSVRVEFTNPDTGWQSSLLLHREGLFSWKVTAVELPDKEIITAYHQRLLLQK